MGKINGSWSGMRKYLETEMITDSLKGRIRYNCTTYVGMDGFKVFEIFVDGKMIKRFSLETVNSYFIKNNYKKKSNSEYWDEFWDLMDSVPIENRTEYTDMCNRTLPERTVYIGDIQRHNGKGVS